MFSLLFSKKNTEMLHSQHNHRLLHHSYESVVQSKEKSEKPSSAEVSRVSYLDLYDRINVQEEQRGNPVVRRKESQKGVSEAMIQGGHPCAASHGSHRPFTSSRVPPQPWWERLGDSESRLAKQEAVHSLLQIEFAEQNTFTPAINPYGPSSEENQNVCLRLFEDAHKRDVKKEHMRVERLREVDAEVTKTTPRAALPSVAVNTMDQLRHREARLHKARESVLEGVTFKPALSEHAKKMRPEEREEIHKKREQRKKERSHQTARAASHAAVPSTHLASQHSREIIQESKNEELHKPFLERQMSMMEKTKQTREMKASDSQKYGVYFVSAEDVKNGLDIHALAQRLNQKGQEDLLRLNSLYAPSKNHVRLFERQMIIYKKDNDGVPGRPSARDQNFAMKRLSAASPHLVETPPEPRIETPRPTSCRKGSGASVGEPHYYRKGETCGVIHKENMARLEKELSDHRRQQEAEYTFHPVVGEQSRKISQERKRNPKPLSRSKREVCEQRKLDEERRTCTFRPKILPLKEKQVGAMAIPSSSIQGLDRHKTRMVRAQQLREEAAQKLNPQLDFSFARAQTPRGQTYTVVEPFVGVESRSVTMAERRQSRIESLEGDRWSCQYRQQPLTNVNPDLKSFIERSMLWE